jgi:phenylacetate-CoA ligase
MRPGIGNIYRHRQKEILLFDSLSIEQQHNFILERMKSIVYFAYHNIPFYNRYYAENRFHPDDLRTYQDILKKYTIRYLHGYPSSIYNFALYCKESDTGLKDILSKHLQGAFLISEYPYPQYRNVIEEVFGINTVSWYGHTERCILAYEKHKKYIYEPFHTYGFAEVVPIDGESQLIGTSYYNHASPLIRYNTNDIISGVEEDGILKSFKITKGRDGESVIDKQGNKINLTALIFGRHHKLFNVAKFIQVKQVVPGKIAIYFVADTLSEEIASQLFDSNNVNLDITFIKISAPVLPMSGNINFFFAANPPPPPPHNSHNYYNGSVYVIELVLVITVLTEEYKRGIPDVNT